MDNVGPSNRDTILRGGYGALGGNKPGLGLRERHIGCREFLRCRRYLQSVQVVLGGRECPVRGRFGFGGRRYLRRPRRDEVLERLLRRRQLTFSGEHGLPRLLQARRAWIDEGVEDFLRVDRLRQGARRRLGGGSDDARRRPVTQLRKALPSLVEF